MSLLLAGALVLVEGVALAAVGVAYAVSGLLGHPEDRLGTVLAGLLALLVGGVLAAAGCALRAARSWPWSPTVLAQLLAAVVAVGLLQGGVWPVGLTLLLLAATVLYLLATPEARAVYRSQS